MAYVTTADLKTYLGISGAGDDTLLGDLVSRAEAYIERYTGRAFEASGDTTRSFDAVRDVEGRVLHLDADLCSITTVTNGDGATIASSNYVTEPRNDAPYYALRILDSSTVVWEEEADGDVENAITIEGRWGYSTSPPADIVQVCVELAGLMYRQRDTSSDLNRPVVVGNATILPGGLSSQSQDTLNSYRKRVYSSWR